MQKIWYLQNLTIFDKLKEEEVKKLEASTTMKEIKKGDTFYFQNDSREKEVYILKKGVVKISKMHPNGKLLTLDIFKEGTIFGEMNLIGTQEEDEAVEVIEDGLICTMSCDDFAEILKLVPDMSLTVTKLIGLRRKKIENKLFELLYKSVEQRLASTVLNLAKDFGIPHEKGVLIKLKLTHQDLADLIASTRETVTATLNKMKGKNLIDSQGKFLILSSADALEAIL